MHDNIAKKRSKSLVLPTGKTTDHMAFKFFPDRVSDRSADGSIPGQLVQINRISKLVAFCTD